MATRAKRTLTGFLALALSFLVLPGAVEAQERDTATDDGEECTATVTPESIQAGQSAVSLTARLSESVGEVDDFDGGDSGLELADQGEIPQREMTREEAEDEPQPIQTTRGEQSEVNVWLNTEDVESGSHEVTLQGEDGECSATVTVGPQGGADRPEPGR